MALNKPHNLGAQNEELKRMLGMVPGVEDKPAPTKSLMSNTSKKSFSNFSESSMRKKPLRASSTIRESTTVKPTPTGKAMTEKGNDSDWEIEPLELMTERMELEAELERLEERTKKQREAHKHNFLHRWLENTERTVQEARKQKPELLPRPEFLKRRDPPAPKSPQKAKSILKAPKAALAEAATGAELKVAARPIEESKSMD